MGTIEDALKNLDNREFLNNSGLDYLIALGLFILYFSLVFILKSVLLHRLKRRYAKTDEIERVEILVKNLDNFINLKFGTIVAIYLATLDLKFPDYLTRLIDFIVLFFIAWLVLKFFDSLADGVIAIQIKRNKESRHIAEFLKMIADGAVFVIVSIWFLTGIGINVTGYLAGLTVLGLGIAFALQNIIADLFASLVLYFDKPFEIGDSIKVGSDSGTVEKIGLRSTHIRTGLGNLLVISNRELSNKRINNLKNMNERRIALNIGVGTETPAKLLEALPNHFKKIIDKTENTRFNRAFFTSIGDFSFNYEIVYYVTTRNYTAYLEAQQKINLEIIKLLEKLKITMPFPTQALIIEKSE